MHFRLSFCFILLLTTTASAQSSGTFSVPCQSRDVFLSRLRSLLSDPQRASDALNQFAIQVEADSDGSWTLTVSQPDNPENPPRTLRQASCPQLAEAGALVVSAWIEESAPPAPPPPAAPVVAASALAPPPRVRTPEKRHLQLGVALNCDGALGMLPEASIGASGAIWFLSSDQEALTSFGVSAWPTHRRDDAEVILYRDYQRPLWTLDVQQIRFLVDADPVQLGVFGALHIGSRRSNDAMVNEFTIGISAGAALRWSLGGGPFALRFQVGVAPSLGDRKTPGVASIALDLALN